MEDGNWVTINGAHVFIKEGQNPMDAFIKQKGGNKNYKLEYNSELEGKLTRNKFKDYLDSIKEEISKRVDTNEEFKDYNDTEKRLIKNAMGGYENTLLNMRKLGYGMKDITKLSFNDNKNNYEILATFDNGNEIVIEDIDKY